MSAPLVSIIIDNYNYAAYLADAIDSALGQTYGNVEVIVVDDGSTDDSRAIIAGYGERIRAVLQENRGQAGAFNTGAAAARGEVLCFLDSDDLWYPQKVERVMAAFERYPAAGWLRHRLRVTDERGEPRGALLPGITGTKLREPVALAFIEGLYPVLTSGMVLRRRVAERIFPLPEVTRANGGFEGVDLKRDADAYLAFRSAWTREPFLSLDEVLGDYRRHPHQQYNSAAELERILQRQMALAAGVATAFDDQIPPGAVPSSVFKHRAVLAALQGRPVLHPDRLAPAFVGMRRILRLAPVSPRLFARQTLALALGTFAPNFWMRKLMRQQGFVKTGHAP